MEDKPALKHEDSGATDAVGGRVPQQWLMDGFVEARARFQAAVDRDARPEDTFIPLFEALSWIHTIDDFLKNRGIKDEESLRRGFRFVRNRVHHQWADAIDPKPVEVSSSVPILGDVRVTVGGHSIDWFWKPLEALPSGRGDDEGERHYRELLAENPVRDALEMLEISLRR